MSAISNNVITDVSSIELNRADRSSNTKLLGQSEDKKIEQNIKQETLVEANKASEVKKEAPTEAKISSAQLEMVAQQLQDFVGEMNKGLEFSVDKDSGRDIIKVVDKKSGDLIKQYPTEEVLSLVTKLSDAAGSLVNETI